MELREYQTRAVEMLRETLKKGKRKPVMVLPTGGGKSIIFGQVISNIVENGKKVLWIVHRRNLVTQMKDTLERHFNINPGIIMAGVEADTSLPVQLCTIQTFARRMDLDDLEYNRFMVPADVVLIDEGHRSISPSYQKVLTEYREQIVIATTATPIRADGRGLGEFYDSLVVGSSVKDLTDQGYLSPARYFTSPNSIDLEGARTKMGDYLVKDLDGKMNKTKLVGDIVENWLRLAESRKTIVYAVNVKHSKAIAEEFQKNGVAAEHLDAHSSDDARDDVFRRMENGDLTVICNVALYQEGLDVPDVSCIVMARPTKSLGLYRQSCGRGLRPAPGKRDTLILDHGNVIEEHGLLDWETEWTLDGEKRAWSKPKRETVSKLVKCRACHQVFMGSSVCPDCGTPVKSFGKKIVTVEAELEELGKKEKHTMAEKRHWYAMFKYHARQKGYKDGWCYHKYKEKFKVEPKGMKDLAPLPPTDEFNNYIRHLNIRFAKSKRKKELDEKTRQATQRGQELAEQYSLGLRQS
jgi:DNA repair protein RadD